MRLTLLALAGATAAFLVTAGTALADSGTFSGSVTATACGPLQPIHVAAGETTIDVVAAETIAANDITIELFDPSGVLKAHQDTLTSPEELVYQSPDLQAGTWNVQVLSLIHI